MNKRIPILFVALLMVFTVQLYAQSRYGVVLGANTHEPIFGANVLVVGTTIGASANKEGFFSLQGFPKPPFQIRVSAVGYETNVIEILEISEHDTVTFLLEPIVLEGVEIIYEERTFCDNRYPNWGESLGIVSFVTDRIFIVTDGEQTQIWSDDVTATGCQNGNCNYGHNYVHFIPGCCTNKHRRDIHPRGDLFSWCAVYHFRNQLCPDGWRVPTVQDFENLDKIMRNRSKKSGTSVIRQYLGSWGGYTSMVQRGDHCALYWSQSAGNRDNSAYYLMLFPDRSSVSLGSKGSFSTLRCIWIN